jgi:cell division protein FtsI (penicillin-binding protein 3)
MYTVALMVRGAKRNYQGSQLAAPIFKEIAASLISYHALAPQPPHPAPGTGPVLD